MAGNLAGIGAASGGSWAVTPAPPQRAERRRAQKALRRAGSCGGTLDIRHGKRGQRRALSASRAA
nr:MAG TPA: hypothetical protein [Caudoviricetes sp.]